MIKQLIRSIDPRRKLFIDFHDFRNTVFLAGTGRSGTKWVQRIINYNGAYRLMNEPFHSDKTSLISHFKFRQYIRPSNQDNRFIDPVRKILSGNVRSPWIDDLNTKVWVRKRLLKDIRAHHFLKWIKVNFPEIPIILLLRHPIAVAKSKVRLGWPAHPEDFLSQEDLVEDFLSPFREIIQDSKGDFDKHILMWCIENYVPLKQFKKDEFLLVFYENLCTNPSHEIKKIFNFVGEEYKPSILQTLNKRSLFFLKNRCNFDGETLVNNWKKNVTDKELETALRILTQFGLNKIYSDSATPIVLGDYSESVL